MYCCGVFLWEGDHKCRKFRPHFRWWFKSVARAPQTLSLLISAFMAFALISIIRSYHQNIIYPLNFTFSSYQKRMFRRLPPVIWPLFFPPSWSTLTVFPKLGPMHIHAMVSLAILLTIWFRIFHHQAKTWLALSESILLSISPIILLGM